MKVKDQALGFFAIKMKAINSYTRRYIEKQFFKWCVVFVLKVLGKFFWFKNKFFLHQIGKQ
jgi:hypothetical protein